MDKGIAAAIQKSDTGNCKAMALDLDSVIEIKLDTLKLSKEGSRENYILGWLQK